MYKWKFERPRQLINTALSTVLLTFISACSSGDGGNGLSSEDNSNTNFSTSNSSETVLNGNNFGRNLSDIANLRKPITFTVTNPDDRFSFGTAYAARPTASSNGLYWMVYVTNTTANETFCFIQFNGGDYRNDADEIVVGVVLGFTFVDGSVRRLSNSGSETNTCLGPGERGILNGIELQDGLYDSLAGIVFDSISVSSNSSELLAAHVTHEAAFSVIDGSSFNMTVKNIGTEAAILDSVSLYLLVDEENQPLIWGFVSPEDGWDGRLAAGAEGTLFDIKFYDGISNKMFVYLDYDTAGPIASISIDRDEILSPSDFPGADEYNIYINNLRNVTENNKLLLLNR
ncbi:MAG: hypothetical protein OEY00_08115 [Gammaproteobacteria bacterium]|nr:hypothetical protein [Gammaproteobacteria bacterium]